MILKIKPLSANELWQGRRFKTKKYLQYEKDLFKILPNIKIPEGKLRVLLEFGVSNKCADIDNFLKGFFDILQKAYNFDDKNIYELSIKKTIVKKGQEFINFNAFCVF